MSFYGFIEGVILSSIPSVPISYEMCMNFGSFNQHCCNICFKIDHDVDTRSSEVVDLVQIHINNYQVSLRKC